MAARRSFRLRLDLTPDAAVAAILGDPRIRCAFDDLPASDNPTSDEPAGGASRVPETISARVEGRWIELRHQDSPGMTPVLCLELGELDDGGTQLHARWVHEPWELAMRAGFLLYACSFIFALPAMIEAPLAAGLAALILTAFAIGTFRQPRLAGDGLAHAEAISNCLLEQLRPYRRDLPVGAADPFRRALPSL